MPTKACSPAAGRTGQPQAFGVGILSTLARYILYDGNSSISIGNIQTATDVAALLALERALSRTGN